MLLSIKNLNKEIINKRFKIKILNNISLEVFKGDFIAILGESGAGKTTLLNVLAGLDSSFDGIYMFKDKEISKFNSKEIANFRNEEIGVVFQEFNLINDYSVLKNILLPLDYSISKKLSKKEKIQEIDLILKKLDIFHLKNLKVKYLSGGEKQRVAIARALINKPSLILADEPTGALDSKNSSNILEILKSLNDEGKTIIIITHDRNITKYCNRVLVMKDGNFIIKNKY